MQLSQIEFLKLGSPIVSYPWMALGGPLLAVLYFSNLYQLNYIV